MKIGNLILSSVIHSNENREGWNPFMVSDINMTFIANKKGSGYVSPLI